MDKKVLVKDSKSIKDISDANNDLRKLEDILNDSTKFRQQSNAVYNEIISKIEYAPYILVARVGNNLKYGNTPFEKVTNYLARRKIINMLRQAVQAYIVDTAKKEMEDGTND